MALQSYHHRARVRLLLAILILSAGFHTMAAESPCPADRPVDDIIAEVNKQSKKKGREDRSALPQVICVFGWCRQAARTPPTFPQPAPRAETPARNSDAPDVSSSKSVAERCNDAMELALRAAHNVDVGDYSFQQKNYRGALLRYEDAAEQKAADPAIHVRLGRVYEKLDQITQAIEQYKIAEKLAGPAKWSDEARTSLARLQSPSQR